MEEYAGRVWAGVCGFSRLLAGNELGDQARCGEYRLGAFGAGRDRAETVWLQESR